MVKIKINYNNNKIDNISFKGHAMYDDFGKDIVCSSISTCVITTLNACLEFSSDYLDVKEIKNLFVINIKKEDFVCDKLIANMISLLKELSTQYPNNVVIK